MEENIEQYLFSPKTSKMSMSKKTRKSNIFGFIKERNVTFLIDISGSMYHCLAPVKEHLIDILNERAVSFNGDSMFNVIAFSDDVLQWTNRSMPCTMRTVPMATMWIRHLRCKTSTNAPKALMLAFDDVSTEAICIVTDGLPDKKSGIILSKISQVSKGRPVYCIYISSPTSDNRALTFLERLAEQTNGSLHSVSFSAVGTVEKTDKIYPDCFISNNCTSTINTQFNRCNVSPRTVQFTDFNSDKEATCKRYTLSNGCPCDDEISLQTESSMTSLNYSPSCKPLMGTCDTFVPVPKSAWGRSSRKQYSRPNSDVLAYADTVISSRGLIEERPQPPIAVSWMTGRRVLAKGDDGFYYLGKISEVSPSEVFTVEFEKCPAVTNIPFVKDNLVTDIISFEDARRNDISVGDKVLVPPADNGGRYIPGTVVEEVSRRTIQEEGYERKSVMVTLFNGEAVEVEADVACWISVQAFNKISSDLMDVFQRNDIPAMSATYNETPPLSQDTWKRNLSSSGERDQKRPKSPIDELQRKIDKQIKQGEYLLRSLQLDEKDHWKRKINPPYGQTSDTDSDSGVSSEYDIEKRPRTKIKRKSYLHVSEEKPPKSKVDISSVIDYEDREERRALKQSERQQNDSSFGTDYMFDSTVVRKKRTPHPPNKEGYFKHRTDRQRKERLIPLVRDENYFRHRQELLTRWDRREQTVSQPPPNVQQEKVYSKPKKNAFKKNHKRCRTWTGGKVPHPPTNRDTTLSRTVEPRSTKFQPGSVPEFRPDASEYQTSDGVPFPPKTDRKFDVSYNLSKSWTLSDGLNNRDMRRSHDIITNKSREPFYNSFGKKDLEKERKQKAKEESHRLNIERREKERSEKMKTWREAENRMREYRQEIRESVERFFKDKEEAAQARKYDRLEQMRQRREHYDNKDTQREQATQNERQKQLEAFQEREGKRRDEFHKQLAKEIEDQQLKLKRLKRIHEKQIEKEFKRTADVRRGEDLKSYVTEQSRNIQRASILP